MEYEAPRFVIIFSNLPPPRC